MNKPLAERMRPITLDKYIGQAHLTGKGAVLRNAIESEKMPSFILWGPPGVGKTTLATIIANSLDRAFFTLSAINAGVKDIRETIKKAQSQQFFGRPNPILFIDEIHRFSKSQQDSLLGAVEKGIVTLIGATTENPSFEVIPALLSRCQVYVLEHHSKDELMIMVDAALKEDVILKKQNIMIMEYEAMLTYSGGDARKLYNILELISNIGDKKIVVTNEMVKKNLQTNLSIYDKGGEMHYDVISAFIKSIRGSDPNAAVYYLARMLVGGEDIKFIARRLVILASEDIGLANPNALLLANATFQSIQSVGMPESRIILSQLVIYLATSDKSNSAYMAINHAMAQVREEGNLPIPLHLRNAPTKLMKDLDYGKEYKYAHDYKGNFVELEFMPDDLAGKKFYQPASNQFEAKLRTKIEAWWKGKY